ncbi:MAG: RdgB/HAM1 family non-canonical purine NTP pyrophosphatase [Gemmatimonadaceae bacterium]
MTGGATPSTLLIATRSPGKLRELRPLLAREGYVAVDLQEVGVTPSDREDAIEAFDTFEANALAKAKYFHSQTGMPTIADDSGLSVDALGGAPGVRSKRWSGRTDLTGQRLDDANNARLLESMRDFTDRRARFVCAAAYVDAEREVVVRGETLGEIMPAARGDQGFGYDPYFFSADLGRGFGESGTEEKEAVSHRGRAMRALLAAMRAGR